MGENTNVCIKLCSTAVDDRMAKERRSWMELGPPEGWGE